ncbi:MAG TPA: ATP-binding protein [Candidatus Acidoferrales bacterium]|jgi:signal transduction histidine kinase/sensor domain CHASE-containing protein|nr:ATP-binding protein [Candidatus Acidoferrales bacterium]
MTRRAILKSASVVIILAALAAILTMCSALVQRERAESERRAQAEVRQIATQLQIGVMGALEPLARLGTWWLSQGKPLVSEDWRSDAQLFLGNAAGLRQAFWVGTDGVERWSAVPGSAPKTKPVHPDAAIRGLIEDVRGRDSLVVSGLFTAPGITHALYVCVPVHSNQRLAGYTIGLYDATELVSLLVRSGIPRDTAISIGTGELGVYSTVSFSSLRRDQALGSIELPGRTWTVALQEPVHYFREFKGLIITAGTALTGLIYAAGMLLYLTHQRSWELQRANWRLTGEVTRRTSIEAKVRELNRELKNKVEDFQTLLAVTPIGIAIASDPECRTIRVNPALSRMLGVAESCNVSKSGPEAASLPFRLCRDGRELRPEELPTRLAATTAREVIGSELQIVRADGSTIDALFFAAPVFGENGQVRGVIDVAVDISARRALENRLQRAQRTQSLGVMAAGIAHDFNGHLTSIIGNAASALNFLPESSDGRRLVAASLESGHRAADLIRQVLAYTGNAYSKLLPLNFAEVLEEQSLAILGLAGSKAEVRVHIDAHLPVIKADPAQIQQVINSLVQNAAEAIGSAGVIDISASVSELPENTGATDEDLPPGRYVHVEVKDTGLGMAADVATKAFDPFFTTKFLGRGLGLSAVLGIMRAHNGAVRLETIAGSGTSVHLFFPVDVVEHNRASSAQASATQSSNYPPAKPEAFCLLAPQRGLIAIAQN